MSIYNISTARAKLFEIVDETNNTHQPIYIKGKRNNAVLISESDYESMQETMYINSIPGLAESILEASKQSIEECVEWTDDL